MTRRGLLSVIAARVREYGLGGRLLFHGPTYVDDIVSDDAQPDPAVHSDVALISAAVEPVPPLNHADASLGSRAPFLPIAEPSLSLLALAMVPQWAEMAHGIRGTHQ